MKFLFAATVLTAGLLAGCNSAPPPPPPPPPLANAVTGTITLRDPRELGADSKIDLKVVDVAQPDSVLAQTTLSNANKLPASFNLPIDVSKVDPNRTYEIVAVLTDGDRRFLQGGLTYPVLTKKNPAKADISLSPEPTPGEKMYEEFRKAFAQNGNLKQISGKYATDDYGTAWDAFLSNGKVKAVREVTDSFADNGGRTTYKIAYKDEKTWVVVRDDSAAGSNKPFATTKVGWNDDGALVLHEKVANNQTSDVSEADAKTLLAHANAALDVAQGHAPKVNTGVQADKKAADPKKKKGK
jgi:putative lipoprotein